MIFSPSWLDHYVIHIVLQFSVHLVMKYGNHHALISCACVFQPVGHHRVVEIPNRCSKGSIFRIFCCHPNLIVPFESVHNGEHCIPHDRIYQQIHIGQCKFVLETDLIKISKVDAATYLPVLFYRYNFWAWASSMALSTPSLMQIAHT